MLCLADEILENQDLYRINDDFWTFLKPKAHYLLMKKISYFGSISVEWIFNEIVEN